MNILILLGVLARDGVDLGASLQSLQSVAVALESLQRSVKAFEAED